MSDALKEAAALARKEVFGDQRGSPTPVRSAMVDALVRLECGDGCGFPSCECYARTRPSIDMAEKRVLAVLDNLPREAMVSAMSQCSRTDLWAQILNAAIAAARSDAER